MNCIKLITINALTLTALIKQIVDYIFTMTLDIHISCQANKTQIAQLLKCQLFDGACSVFGNLSVQTSVGLGVRIFKSKHSVGRFFSHLTPPSFCVAATGATCWMGSRKAPG